MKKFKALFFSFIPLFICLAIQIISAFNVLFLVSIFGLGSLADETTFSTVTSILYSIVCIFLFGLWLKTKYIPSFKINLKEKIHPYEILGIALLVPGTQFLSSIVTGIIAMIFPSWLDEYMALLEQAGLTGNISFLMMLYSVALAPVCEELVFRGVTMRILESAFPFWFANIIQATLFGIFHLNPIQGCYTFVVGLFMGYICKKGGTLYHAIFFHFLFNLWGTTASQWLIVEDAALQSLIVIVGTFVGLKYGIAYLKRGAILKQPLIQEPEIIELDETKESREE